MQSKTEWKASDIVVIGMMTAAIETAKTVLAFLPNIELVTFLIIVYTLVFGKKTFVAVLAFVGIECLIWGMNLWVINYLYVWPLLVLMTLVMKRRGFDSAPAYAVLAGSFGLGFGALCASAFLRPLWIFDERPAFLRGSGLSCAHLGRIFDEMWKMWGKIPPQAGKRAISAEIRR